MKAVLVTRANDWEIFFTIEDLKYRQARDIEKHIKNMKSKKYITNLEKYPEIIEKLKIRFSDTEI